jgi:REP element-mobilizing transposase RayT
MNRRVDRSPLFLQRADYDHFAALLGWAQREDAMEITAWCLMPNHWHLVLKPHDREHQSRFMQRLQTTHAVGLRSSTNTRGHGSIYGGRFKSFPIPAEKLLRSVVYVERNPVKAGLVQRATAWLHGSAATHGAPVGWPVVTRLPHELERLRPDLLKRPLPEEFEAEFTRWCAEGVRGRHELEDASLRQVRGALLALDKRRRSRQPAQHGALPERTAC